MDRLILVVSVILFLVSSAQAEQCPAKTELYKTCKGVYENGRLTKEPMFLICKSKAAPLKLFYVDSFTEDVGAVELVPVKNPPMGTEKFTSLDIRLGTYIIRSLEIKKGTSNMTNASLETSVRGNQYDLSCR